MSRPRQVTRKAAVYASGAANAALTACVSFASSTSLGGFSAGSAFPIGHGCVDASGNALVTVRGVKFTDAFPTGSVTHPWLPRYFAVRVMPFGIVTWTALLMWSMTGLLTFARSR